MVMRPVGFGIGSAARRLVRTAGVEPAQPCGRGILSPLRLPVSPRPLINDIKRLWIYNDPSQWLCRQLVDASPRNQTKTQPATIALQTSLQVRAKNAKDVISAGGNRQTAN